MLDLYSILIFAAFVAIGYYFGYYHEDLIVKQLLRDFEKDPVEPESWMRKENDG